MPKRGSAPMRFFDELIGASQFAGQFFGFLPDGREAVEIVEEGLVLRLTLSDRASEGWPAVTVSVPAELEFRQATASVLTRAVSLSASGDLDDARAWFDRAGLSFPRNSKCVDLGHGARLKIRTHDGHVSVVIQQRRSDEDVRASVLERVGGSPESS